MREYAVPFEFNLKGWFTGDTFSTVVAGVPTRSSEVVYMLSLNGLSDSEMIPGH